MKTIKIKVYEFDELTEPAKEKAISDWITVALECGIVEDMSGFERAINDANAMHTPWFAGEYILDYCKDEIIKELQTDCWFLPDGTICPFN